MLVGVLLVAVAVARIIRRVIRHSRAAAPPSPSMVVPGIDPADLADLDSRWAAVDAETARERASRLVARLHPLVERQVPVRKVEAVPSLQAARVRFADGTSVLVRGAVPGDVGVLASWLPNRAVIASRCSCDERGARLELRSPGHRSSISIVVAGLDQPD